MRPRYFLTPSIPQNGNHFYFALSNSILVSDYNDNQSSFLDRFVKTGRVYRKDISCGEIYHSFINIDPHTEIKLFFNEHEAYKYSESFIVSKKGNVYQPAVFKVALCKSPIQLEPIEIKIVIQSFSCKEDFDLLCLKNCYQDKNQYILKTNYLSVRREEIIPLEGYLKVQGLTGLTIDITFECNDINKNEEKQNNLKHNNAPYNKCIVS